MNKHDQRLLGYTCREWEYCSACLFLDGDYDYPRRNVWSSTMKSRLLLRDDVLRPLSVDNRIWPTVFDFQGGRDWEEGQILQEDIWSDLECLKREVELAQPGVRSYWYIGVSLLWQDRCEETLWHQVPPPVPKARFSDWELLGYDIADQVLTSGVSNCMSNQRSKFLATKKKWGHRLNAFHLFDNVRDACEYQSFVDSRMTAHAPFFVYGLWLVSKE